ncbi:late secretory pathway protein AVL9 homolog [Amphibalanus amphitrite]|uniref:late secretory pathway protein AVL9 homolog n=1 Tax=Amphibalanus amphitrite TaxID=1232801 RepID=UPI001C901CEC|nr:late secretory pathway protein AVL9 homolog [Amphibalanus amphitrite]XP_043210922.1 late secretory pathway protein AVL9 homolog [Amphibalanus amphitrite]
MEDRENIILHIIVVGFHHKKGYQVEFTHPQWPTGDECPAEWGHLPSIAMPDGSHNYHQETVYFHLPPLDGSDTVYGVSCYRQIDADRVVNRTEDITRKSVQKSVIALSRLPLFGQIQVKLELITSAYFETGDFSQVDVLKKAYTNMNQCLSEEMLGTPQVFVGLSVRDLVLMFRHKLLVLFKLALLERRVLLQHSPVSELCSAVLALTSLFPGMVQHGLSRAALQPRPPSRRTSAVRSPSREDPPAAASAPAAADSGLRRASDADLVTGNSTFYRSEAAAPAAGGTQPPLHRSHSDGAGTAAGGARAGRPEAQRASVFYDTAEAQEAEEAAARSSTFYLGSEGAAEPAQTEQEQEQPSVDARVERLLAAAQSVDDVQCGMPIRRFRKGHLCHPYLCLSDIHLLTDDEVLTFLAGATNVLYSHKRHLVDAYVTMAPCSVELSVPLRRQLALSTEDLRLADLIVRAVTEPGPAGGSDSPTGAPAAPGQPPRGSDAWLRAVFRLYLYMLLRTSLLPDGSAEHTLYNSWYMAALKETPSYVQWADGQHLGVLELNPGHPCSGQLSMADMRLRISQTFQSSERGRRVSQVAVMTGRAVGGALTVARGALTSWWSSLATPEETAPPAEPAEDAAAAAETVPGQSAAPAATDPAASETRPARPRFEAQPGEAVAAASCP